MLQSSSNALVGLERHVRAGSFHEETTAGAATVGSGLLRPRHQHVALLLLTVLLTEVLHEHLVAARRSLINAERLLLARLQADQLRLLVRIVKLRRVLRAMRDASRAVLERFGYAQSTIDVKLAVVHAGVRHVRVS